MPRKKSVHFLNENENWATPKDLFQQLSEDYGPFDLDVCATKESAKCASFYSKEEDAFTKNWHRDGSRAYMNPPYGRQVAGWLQKAYIESKCGLKIVCLLPARTDTAWFHDIASKGIVRFIRGRVRFEGATAGAPFPSLLVLFGYDAESL